MFLSLLLGLILYFGILLILIYLNFLYICLVLFFVFVLRVCISKLVYYLYLEGVGELMSKVWFCCKVLVFIVVRRILVVFFLWWFWWIRSFLMILWVLLVFEKGIDNIIMFIKLVFEGCILVFLIRMWMIWVLLIIFVICFFY